MSEQQIPEWIDEEDDDRCQKCDGSGDYVWCVDDMCRGQGWCIHGCDICPECHGSGTRSTS